ncbi:MAG: HK97 family phage prohead protease [Pseudomonadota bacterium]
MPIPTPHKGEKQDDFIDRCMGDETMNSEYPDEKQRSAICYQQWKDKDQKDNQPADIETRVLAPEDVELRIVQDDGGPRKLVGYAAVFNRDSLDLGGFIEQVKPGAFAEAIKTSDVRALVNHDAGQLIGRTKSKTLRLSEDKKGLRFEIDLPETRLAADLAASIGRGDMDGCSFTFRTKSDKWIYPDDESKPVRRELIECDPLFDVGPVTYPAYPDTAVALRSLEAAKQQEEQKPPAEPQPEPEAKPTLSVADAEARIAKTKVAVAKLMLAARMQKK